ncbi:MAG: hypothetical protein U0169_04915 [Polyangiaceae bacterium]
MWQATTAEISSVDTANPSGFKQDTVPLPAKAVDGATGRMAELYRKLEGDKLVTFAHYDGDDVYYRITQTCLMSENTCTVFWDEVSMQFTLKDGTFEEVTQHLVDKTQVVSVTTKFSAVPFPPAGWPTRVVAHDLGARQ